MLNTKDSPRDPDRSAQRTEPDWPHYIQVAGGRYASDLGLLTFSRLYTHTEPDWPHYIQVAGG
eukprot:1191849-Prorocentrum_minimum.AAC.1